MTQEHEALLYLTRLGIGHNSKPCFTFEKVDWGALMDLSWMQCVAAIALDGLQHLFEVGVELNDPELEKIKFEWMGRSVSLEQEYGRYLEVIGHLAKFYEECEIPMMLLKGYGASLNYPVPAHRPTGDIDVYLWDRWKEADSKVTELLGIRVDNSHHHHSVFMFEGRSIENHYDFVNVHSHLSNREVEACFKRLAAEGRCPCLLPNGVKIYLPSADLNALFLARHCAAHFAAERLTLRQLLDWALFVEKYY